MSGLSSHALDLTGLAGDRSSRVHALDPRAKIVGLLAVTLVAVSTPLRAWPVWLACAAVLAAYATAARVPARTVWRRARVVLPLVLFVAAFLPFVRRGGASVELGPATIWEAGLAVLATVAAKATLGTASAVLLGATTPFPAVLHGLERLRVPRLLTLIAAFMYRYLHVVVEEVGRMRLALAARAYRPRHLLHAGAIGRVAAALFLRTHARGERVYLAMVARGFRGTMPEAAPLAFARAEVVFLATVLAALLPLRVAAEVLA